MWDIKLDKMPAVKVLVLFYLNHVGYKGVTAVLADRGIMSFYLNHVGYKVCNRHY